MILSYYFLSKIVRPPLPTLFPYTTLFRSVIFDATAIKSSEMSYENNDNPNGFDGREICALARYAGISSQVTSFGVYELDRKSTRLNSSHVRISYAVFCLKKKIQQ